MKQSYSPSIVIKILRILFQHCCSCGAPTFRNSFLCRHCLSITFNLNGSIVSNNYLYISKNKFCCLSLGTYSSHEVRTWVRALKNGGTNEDYIRIARTWLVRRNFNSEFSLNFPITIIPSPSHIIGAKDHAFCLAKALSDVTGWHLNNILEFKNTEIQAQKGKTLNERKQRVFKLRENIKILTKNPNEFIENVQNVHIGTIIFVDDVVTTGNTALAAWKALQHPINFEIWCIAIQPRTNLI